MRSRASLCRDTHTLLSLMIPPAEGRDTIFHIKKKMMMFNIFIQHTVCYLGLVSDLSIQICSVPPGSTLWPAGSPG